MEQSHRRSLRSTQIDWLFYLYLLVQKSPDFFVNQVTVTWAFCGTINSCDFRGMALFTSQQYHVTKREVHFKMSLTAVRHSQSTNWLLDSLINPHCLIYIDHSNPFDNGVYEPWPFALSVFDSTIRGLERFEGEREGNMNMSLSDTRSDATTGFLYKAILNENVFPVMTGVCQYMWTSCSIWKSKDFLIWSKPVWLAFITG